MDFDFSKDEKLIQSTIREFLEKECPSDKVRELEEDEKGYDPVLWGKMAELGYLGLLFPEEYGGMEGSFIELMIVAEELGRACAPSWFFSTVVLGAQAILTFGREEQKRRLLSEIARGESLGTLALIEPRSGYDVTKIEMTANEDAGGFLISGTKLFVPDAHIADWIVCVTRGKRGGGDNSTPKLFLIDREAPGISITPLKTISGDRLFEVKFDQVEVSEENLLGGGGHHAGDFERMLQQASLAKCGEMVGGAQRVLEMSVDHAKQRIQFDRPIGSFQAVQHHCANMLIDLDCSRFLAYYAAWLLSEGLPCDKEIAMAKAFTGDAYVSITTSGQQIHGGTGLTREHDMQLYFRRAKASALSLGNSTFQREKIAREMGL
ncbi:acyl-CoA dehydrogenase family protein [Thermodesulfobacteriota bacterium]